MHQNAPFQGRKYQNFSGEGAAPSQTPPPLGRGIPPPQIPSPVGAFGASIRSNPLQTTFLATGMPPGLPCRMPPWGLGSAVSRVAPNLTFSNSAEAEFGWNLFSGHRTIRQWYKKAVLSQRWPRNAPYMGALKIFGTPWLHPRPLFPIFSEAFVLVDPMNVHTKFEVRSFTHCWDNRGYPKKLGSPRIRPRSVFWKKF